MGELQIISLILVPITSIGAGVALVKDRPKLAFLLMIVTLYVLILQRVTLC